jgi:hypothetical protein
MSTSSVVACLYWCRRDRMLPRCDVDNPVNTSQKDSMNIVEQSVDCHDTRRPTGRLSYIEKQLARLLIFCISEIEAFVEFELIILLSARYVDLVTPLQPPCPVDTTLRQLTTRFEQSPSYDSSNQHGHK